MMNISIRQAVTLLYLMSVLLLGGASAAGYGGNLALQLCGAALIGLTLWSTSADQGTPSGLKPFFVALGILLLLQFVPMPPLLWEALPGRAAIAKGYELAAIDKPWLTLSLDPWGSLQSITWWLPAAAIFISMRAQQAPETRHTIWLVVSFAFVSVVFAAIQAWIGTGYFYTVTNFGVGVGFFANSNHLTTFLLIACALSAGQWLHDRPAQKHAQRSVPELALIGLLLPLIIGIAITGSLAGQLLTIPLVLGIWLIARPNLRLNWYAVFGLLLLLGIGLVWLLGSGLVSNDLMSKTNTVGISRGEFLTNGIAMLRDFAPFGSGLGTFSDIYPWYEDAAKVGRTYVNHAHNDALELLIETGLLGLIVATLFLRWYSGVAWSLWNGNRTQNPVALAATIAIALVLMHSLVDYPLRTASVSSLIALCCVLLVRPAAPRGAAADAGPGSGKRESMMEI